MVQQRIHKLLLKRKVHTLFSLPMKLFVLDTGHQNCKFSKFSSLKKLFIVKLFIEAHCCIMYFALGVLMEYKKIQYLASKKHKISFIQNLH